ncbi:MAG: Ig-like domain-containing protein [Gemmatimonadales bacterium]
MSMLLLLLALQGAAPLRKSDLVRLLSGAVMAPPELAQLVRRNCLSFAPTERDRSDFSRLGAEASLLAAVDDCGRRAAARAMVPIRAVAAHVPAAPLPPPRSISMPARSIRVAAERSGFVSGGGQRGSAGALLPRAVVFEARDSLGAPLAGQIVTFTGINARIEPANVSTDGAGQARAGVTLGQRMGSATVIAAIGVIERQVAFNVAAGSAAALVLMCGPSSLSTRFAVRPDTVIVLRVAAQDAFANPTPLLGLRAAVADARIVRVLRVAQDSAAGTVALKPDQPGTTSLAVIANGMRQYLTVTVPPRAAPGKVDCR